MNTDYQTRRVVLGGFAGTTVMTLVLFFVSSRDNLNIDFATMLSEVLLNRHVEFYSLAWWMGTFFYFIIGSVFLSLLYAKIFYFGLRGNPVRRGVHWGLILWFVMMFFLMPIMGKGFFGMYTPKPFALNVAILIGYLSYGFILGAIAGRQESSSQVRRPLLHG